MCYPTYLNLGIARDFKRVPKGIRGIQRLRYKVEIVHSLDCGGQFDLAVVLDAKLNAPALEK